MTTANSDTLLERPAPAGDASEDSAKRRQIIDGATEMFLAKGFDAASMADIARAAGVSKGTLYVYFKDKEELFRAIVQAQCSDQAETFLKFDLTDADVEGTLMRIGVSYINFLCQPEKASALRTVIAIADRMPSIGRTFYEAGPQTGINKLAAYLRAQTEAGILNVDDPEIAAAQFKESCQATLFKPVLFNFAPAPTPERVERVIGIAVRTFMAAYKAK